MLSPSSSQGHRMQFGQLTPHDIITLLCGVPARRFAAQTQTWLRKLLLLSFATVSISAAQAQVYPSRPITIVVPGAAGGPEIRSRAW